MWCWRSSWKPRRPGEDELLGMGASGGWWYAAGTASAPGLGDGTWQRGERIGRERGRGTRGVAGRSGAGDAACMAEWRRVGRASYGGGWLILFMGSNDGSVGGGGLCGSRTLPTV